MPEKCDSGLQKSKNDAREKRPASPSWAAADGLAKKRRLSGDAPDAFGGAPGRS